MSSRLCRTAPDELDSIASPTALTLSELSQLHVQIRRCFESHAAPTLPYRLLPLIMIVFLVSHREQRENWTQRWWKARSSDHQLASRVQLAMHCSIQPHQDRT